MNDAHSRTPLMQIIYDTIIDTITIFVLTLESRFEDLELAMNSTQKCASAKILCKDTRRWRWSSFGFRVAIQKIFSLALKNPPRFSFENR